MLALVFATVLAAEPPRAAPPKPAVPPAAAKTAPRRVKVLVTEKGFEPSRVDAKAGEKLVLQVTRKTEATCAHRILVPDQQVDVELPLDKEVEAPVDAAKAGTIRFGCQMGLMISGAVVVK